MSAVELLLLNKSETTANQNTGCINILSTPGKSKQPPFPGKLGCDVLDRSCNLWVSEQHSNHDNIYPFCGISSQSYTCNTQHTTVSRCQSKEHSVGVVPAKFQYHGLAGTCYIKQYTHNILII